MFHSSPSPPLFAVLLQCPCRRLFSLRASACPTFTMGKIYHFADEESTLSPRWRLFIFPLQRLADWELDIQVITGVSRFPPLRITLAATYCTVAQFYLGVALVPSSLLIIRVCVCVCVCCRCGAGEGETWQMMKYSVRVIRGGVGSVLSREEILFIWSRVMNRCRHAASLAEAAGVEQTPRASFHLGHPDQHHLRWSRC